MAGISRPPGAIPPPHPAGGVASGVGPNQGSGPPPGYVGNQQQAAMMKQMMAMEQEKRVQMHMLEQQKLFREQRQQQQQQLLAEQVCVLHERRARCPRAAVLVLNPCCPANLCVNVSARFPQISASALILSSPGCLYNYSQPPFISSVRVHVFVCARLSV